MIVDYIENLKFDLNEEDYYHDAKVTLFRLSQGLFWLNNNVTISEKKARSEAKKEDVLIGIADGVLKDLDMNWMSCAFQWYAVSLYNYIRLIGWLVSKDKDYAIKYVNRIIPSVKNYRHKIAAHFAITYPKDDNEADLISSIKTNIVYAHGYLRAGAMSEVITDDKGNEIETSTKTSWSMTKIHNKLIPRYWPDGPANAYQSIKVSAKSTRTFKIDWDD